MPLLDHIINSELDRRCLKPSDVRVEPVLWSAENPIVLTYETTPGGLFYLIEKAYGIEFGSSKMSGTYFIKSAKAPLSLSFKNVQHGTPSSGILAQAAPWSFDHPTLHEGLLQIAVSGPVGQWSLSLQMIVVHPKQEGDCEKC